MKTYNLALLIESNDDIIVYRSLPEGVVNEVPIHHRWVAIIGVSMFVESIQLIALWLFIPFLYNLDMCMDVLNSSIYCLGAYTECNWYIFLLIYALYRENGILTFLLRII